MMEIQPWLGFAHPVSSMLHIAGTIIFSYLAFALLKRGTASNGHVVSIAIFAFSCIFLLVVSSIYHFLNNSGITYLIFQRLDHAAIFLVIAGSFTPLHYINFSGFFKWGILAIVWSFALTGLIVKTLFFTEIPEWFGLAFYLAMGWIGIITGFLLWRKYGLLFITPLWMGGFFYTLGGLIEFRREPVIIPGIVSSHELLHISVLIGIGLHWWFLIKTLDRT